MKTLAELNADLDALYATVDDEHEDTTEILAKQEYLLNAILRAEASSLDTLSAKELTSHFQRRAPGVTLPKGISKAKIIERINALPALPPSAVEPEAAPASAQADTAADDTFTVSGWAKANGKDAREVRKALRALGKRAPYSLTDVQQLDKVAK